MKYVRIIFALLVVAFGVWLYFSSKGEKLAADNAYKALQAKYADSLKEYSRYRKLADSAAIDARAKADQAGETAKKSQMVLNGYRRRVNSLLAFIDSAKMEAPDSTWIAVSPNYILGCDSISEASRALNNLVVQYEQDNQAHVDALNYETYVRDSALLKERAFNESFRAQLTDCINTIKDQERARRPKPQLYAGMAAWGNAISPLGGGEINIGLKTPSDQFYEIKGAYLGKWWVGVGTKFKLSF
jgi:hypothetical protein